MRWTTACLNITGSAIQIDNGISTTVTNSVFFNNTGGGIYDYSSSNTTIFNSKFQNSTNIRVGGSQGWGGAIYSGSLYLNIEQSDFLGNIAADGGGVFMSGHTSRISNCVFKDNKAVPTKYQGATGAPFSDTQDGGAIYFYNSGSNSQTANQNFAVVNSTFVRNFAWGSAGAIRSWQVVENVIVNQCSFAKNMGLSIAADLYIFGDNERLTNLFVRNSYFIDSQVSASINVRSAQCFGLINTVCANSTKQGLHILDVGGQCENTFSDEIVLFNRSSISVDSAAVASISDFIGHDVSYSIIIDIRGCKFDNISSQAVSVQGGLNSRIVVAQTNFIAGYSGAALDLTACENTIVWGCVFGNNLNYDKGGAISSLLHLASGMFIGNSAFTNNSALSGGAVYGGAGAQFNITGNSYFPGNWANNTGGGIQCDSWLCGKAPLCNRTGLDKMVVACTAVSAIRLNLTMPTSSPTEQ